MDTRLTSTRFAVVATLLAASAAAAGLLVTGLYRDSPNWIQQARGTDLATLLPASSAARTRPPSVCRC